MVKLQNLLNEKSKGLWHNIHAKRKRGEAPAKPGDEDYPKTLDIDEKVIKVSKKDDVPGNPMKMRGEEKIKKLVYSGSNGTGSYEIKGKNLNVIGIRPRDKGFFVRHFTNNTGFRKANLYYDGVQWQGDKKFESVNESDLGLTLKKGKTIKVTHEKSGKELVIIDKPNVRKEYEKIGFFAEGSCGYGIDGKVGSQPAGPHLIKKKKKKVDEGQKRDANNLAVEFGKSFQRFTVAVNGLAKSMTNITGDKTDGKIIMKAFKKHIIPFVQLVDNWNSGQQKNPHIDESVNEKVTYHDGGRTVGIDVRDIYDYMVSIKKTNPAKFKKDMQNRHLKAIFKRYSKGGEMYREGFGGELKGKDKEKFEKERKENAEVLGYKLTGKSDINEVNIKDIQSVLKKKQAKKINGMYMDMTTANAIMTVYKALNKSNQKKFTKLPLTKMVDVTWKLVK